MSHPTLAEIRGRVRRYQSNPYSVDASADMAACCDIDVTVLLDRYEALLAALDALVVDWEAYARRESAAGFTDRGVVFRSCADELAAALATHREAR
jgi:hypothetical protein